MADLDKFGNEIYDNDIFGNKIDYKKKYDEAASDRHMYMSKLIALERAVITAAIEKLNEQGLHSDECVGMDAFQALEVLRNK